MPSRPHPTVLVADDDEDILKALSFRLEAWGYQVRTAQGRRELFDRLASERPLVVILDLQFGRHDGIEVMTEYLQLYPGLTTVILTGNASIDSAVSSMKSGAFDYLTKPMDTNRLRVVLEHAVERHALGKRVERLEEIVAEHEGGRTMWGSSPAMSQLREMIRSIAPTSATVLVVGPSGTGKELVARSLHDQSARANGPFVPVNMAALPRELVESTLFGHEKGAFTGADRVQVGCCEAADGGTLFLDEIGEMDISLQAKLLRFLQERSIQRVGATRPRQVDVRVVAATNRDLLAQVRAGSFREDLYYRLNVVPITVPPLRERREDVPELATRFLQRAGNRYRKEFSGFSPTAVAAMVAYDWPGNIRQLENLVERMAILNHGPEIGLESLPTEIRESASAVVALPTIESQRTGGVRTLDELEKEAIVEALRQTHGNAKEAGALLGLSPATVYRKIKAYGIKT